MTTSATRDELERYTVKVATSMQTVVHRKVMEYILPKAREGRIEVSEVEHLLVMADAFKVLDDPVIQERMETLLTSVDHSASARERVLVMAALGADFGESFGKDDNGIQLPYAELREAKIAAIFQIVERAYLKE